MATRGVWSLENVESRYPLDEWVDYENVWIPAPPEDVTSDTCFWYLTGDGGGAVKKFPASTDSWETNPQIPHATTCDFNGSQTEGICNGGSNNSWYKKVTYATDAVANVHPGGGDARRRGNAISVGSGTKGYWCGGELHPGSTITNETENIVYGSGTVQRNGPDIPAQRQSFQGSTNSSIAGFICGGSPGYSGIVKLTFSSETCSELPSTNFGSTIHSGGQAATGDYDTFGYFAGGYVNPSTHATSVNMKLTYATETMAREPSGNTPRSSYFWGTTGTRTHGYWGGGESVGSGKQTNIFKLTFSNATFANVPSSDQQISPTSAAEHLRGFGPRKNTPTAGPKERWFDGALPAPSFALWAGGYVTGSPDRTSRVAKWTYSTGSGAVLPSSSLTERTSSTCSVGSPDAGYWKGGYGSPGPGTYWSYTWKCVYSTETSSEIPGLRGGNPGWSSGRTTAGLAVGNTTKGYFGAGGPSYSSPFANASISRIPWATETNHNQPGANLRNPVIFLTGAGSQEVGYAFGGQQSNGNELSYVDKLTYATDTRSGGGNMTTYHYSTGSASSDTASYCFGGAPSPNIKIVEKYVWATYTCSADTALGSNAENGVNANGRTVAGLLAGGGDKDSSVQKYTYTTSTSSMEPGNMGYGARYMGGASASNNNGPQAISPEYTPTSPTTNVYPATLVDFGYQQGGLAGGHDQKDVMKLTFANDTAAEIPGADLPANRHFHATFSSTLASYVSGGKKWPNITNDSTIDKTVYATDTSSNVVNGSSDNLEPGRHKCSGAMNSTNGWTIGGSSQGQSRVDKFFFSSETNQGDGYLTDTPNPQGRWWFSTLSAPEHIYCVGGENRSNYWKFTYSISSQAEVPGATIPRLSAGIPGTYGAKAMTQGIGNSTQGYAGGGMSGSNPITNIDKIVYATDTVTSGVAALLSGRYGVSNLGTDIQGYWLGGRENPGSPAWDNRTTTKMPFSTDTLAIAPGAWDSSYNTRYSGFGSGAKSFGTHRTATPNVI